MPAKVIPFPRPISLEAQSVLRLTTNLLRVPASVANEVLDIAEYIRHTNAQYAIDALRESEQNRAS